MTSPYQHLHDTWCAFDMDIFCKISFCGRQVFLSFLVFIVVSPCKNVNKKVLFDTIIS